jgi:hypothetical protein
MFNLSKYKILQYSIIGLLSIGIIILIILIILKAKKSGGDGCGDRKCGPNPTSGGTDCGLLCSNNQPCDTSTGQYKVPCVSPQICKDGSCQNVGCEPPCVSPQICKDGSCQNVGCEPPCVSPQICKDGSCQNVGGGCDDYCNKSLNKGCKTDCSTKYCFHTNNGTCGGEKKVDCSGAGGIWCGK